LHWKFGAAPCFALAFLTHLIGSGIKDFSLMELLWTFSIYLEAVAILPQLIVLQRYGEVENLTGNYIFFMGAYRALYILNWIYRANFEEHYRHHWVVYICGVIQTLLYADFFYYYLKRCVSDQRKVGSVACIINPSHFPLCVVARFLYSVNQRVESSDCRPASRYQRLVACSSRMRSLCATQRSQ